MYAYANSTNFFFKQRTQFLIVSLHYKTIPALENLNNSANLSDLNWFYLQFIRIIYICHTSLEWSENCLLSAAVEQIMQKVSPQRNCPGVGLVSWAQHY